MLLCANLQKQSYGKNNNEPRLHNIGEGVQLPKLKHARNMTPHKFGNREIYIYAIL